MSSESISAFSDHEETLGLIACAQRGDKEAKERLFKSNVGLIYMVLERFKATGYEFEDLFQVGGMGLVKAIERFDPAYGVRFSTYAVPMIIGEIKRHLRDDGPLKVARGVKETYARIKWAREQLAFQKGREPTVGEIAEVLGMSREDVVMVIEACQAPVYIFESLNHDDEGLRVLDTLEGDFAKEEFLDQIALKEALQKLDKREREIIVRRFLKEETQTAIASDLGISQVQVSRLEKKALKRLREMLA